MLRFYPLLVIHILSTSCKMFKKDSKLESQTITSINKTSSNKLERKETNIYMDQYPGGIKSEFYPYLCIYTSQAPLWWKNSQGEIEPAPYAIRNMEHLKSFKRYAPKEMPRIAPYIPVFKLSKRLSALADQAPRDAKRAELEQQKLQLWQGFVSRVTANAFATIGFLSNAGMRLLSMKEAEKMNIVRLGESERQQILSSLQKNELFIRQQQTIAQKAQLNVETLFKTGAVYLASNTESKNVGINVGVFSASLGTSTTKQELRGSDEGVMGSFKDSLAIALPGSGTGTLAGFIKPPSNNIEALHSSLGQAKSATDNILSLMDQMKTPLSALHDVANKTHSLLLNADGQVLGGATQLIQSLTAPDLLLGAKVAAFAGSTVADFVMTQKIGKKLEDKTSAMLEREYIDIFSNTLNATQSSSNSNKDKNILIDAYDIETLPILDKAVIAMVEDGSIDTTISCPSRRLDPATYQLVK